MEQIQDIVEIVLQAAGEFGGKALHIVWGRTRKIAEERPIPVEVKAAFAESDQPYPTAEVSVFDKYSRFNYDLGRRNLGGNGRPGGKLCMSWREKLEAEEYEK